MPTRGSGPGPAQLAIAGAVAVLAVIAVIVFGNASSSGPAAPAPQIRASANMLGDASAPVLIEEWADFQCPACRAFASTTEPDLRSTYIATGKVRFVFHHMAFLGLESVWAAEAAECAAGDNHFWDFHDGLYSAQSGENSGTFSKVNLQKIADGIGLGVGFNACLTSDRFAQRVRDETAAGQARGVNATPTLFVNGRRLEGVQSIAQLRAIIDPLLK